MWDEGKLLVGLKVGLKQLISLTDDAWESFEKRARFHQFKKGDYVFQAGLPGAQMHFLREGLVRLFYLREDGKEFNKSFIKPNDVVASVDQALFNRPPLTVLNT